MMFVPALYCADLQTVEKYTQTELKKMIGSMLIVGFDEENISKKSDIFRYIKEYDLGGVILFDRFYSDRKRVKNIRNPKQLKELSSKLQAVSDKHLIIALDQEGGRVERMKKAYGFGATPSAAEIGIKDDPDFAKKVYGSLAKELHRNGINCDFAPVVDLGINPDNKVIYKLGRSFGKSPEKVVKYAGIFIDELKKEGVISVLKHFPGHGSSLADSHKGFVDISDTWSSDELIPYERLIKEKRADIIMTAHVFNRHLDPKYPATLSYRINTDLLRKKMGYEGVIVSDDMQMNAISKEFSLKESVTLAINSGVDILLFGNQLAFQDVDELIDIIYKEVKRGNIELSRIVESNRRVAKLLKKYDQRESIAIVDKPIDFGKNREEMTKEYIKKHYALEVDDITIEPRIIVLHWTAIPTFKDSYARLKPERLLSDRKDIVKASALNVSAHFLIDRDGTVYRLMRENWMARHVIGLNYSSIGIENVGGRDNTQEDLTEAQVRSNIALIRYLKGRYPKIEYLIGHHEYRSMEQTPLWLERDSGYRTVKSDPGPKFMKSVREGVKELNLKEPPLKKEERQ